MVDNVRKGLGGNLEEILSIEKYKTEVEIMERTKGNASAKKHGERGGTLRDTPEVKRRIRNETVFVRPTGLRENARVGDLDLPEKKK